LYSSPCEAEENVPLCELRAFAKTGLLESGASETVSLRLTPDDLAHFSEARSAWITPVGSYGLVVARDANRPELEASVKVRKEQVRKVSDVLHPSQPEGRPLYLGGGSAITR
jgi:beta-glucosidase